MFFSCRIFIFLLFTVKCVSIQKRPKVHILKVFSEYGGYAFTTDVFTITKKWQEHLTKKFLLDDSWPFECQIELLNINSSYELGTSLLEARLSNKNLPNVTLIVGPEGDLGSASAAPIASKYGLPLVLASSNPTYSDYGDPPCRFNTTFFIEAPEMFTYRSMIDEYLRVGVKTMVFVSSDDLYNANSCLGTADYLATPRGIEVLAKFAYSQTDVTSAEVLDIVKQIKQLNPDAVHWCHWQSCWNSDRWDDIFALKKFKELDYLPNAFTTLDCFDYEPTYPLIRQGYFDYTGAGVFFHKDLKGADHTEDDNPYSNVFRPTNKVQTVNDALNTGTSKTSPSSAYLFYQWYKNTTGFAPMYQTVGEWAAFDLIEGAIYRATQTKAFMADGVISPSEVQTLLSGAQASGPYGRVVFDAYKVNSVTPAFFVQLLSNSVETTIVAPSTISSMEFIYPMPTWKERVYEWSIVKGEHTKVGVIIACVCSAILLVMAVTLVVHRSDVTVRMVHFGHMASLCIAGIIVCMSLAFLWQADVKQFQCNLYLWATYLPASYMVQLINMKAYRLSCFLRSDGSSASLKKLRDFTHLAVLMKTLQLTFVTLVILIIVYVTDTPEVIELVVDKYRPALTYHYCKSGQVTQAFVILLIIWHVLVSMFCIVSIRNGMEAFRDGLVMKEAFVALYALVLIAAIMSTTSLSYTSHYVMRTACLCFGITFFSFRLLISRCLQHWVPLYIRNVATALYVVFKRKYSLIFPALNMPTSSSISVMEDEKIDNESPLYNVAAPSESSIAEMLKIIKDPKRSILFRNLAEKAHVVENVDFLIGVLQYVDKADRLLIQNSIHTNKELKDEAKELYVQFIKANSEHEVNVSHKTRLGFEEHLRNWEESRPLINQKQATLINSEDTVGRSRIFDSAMKEISVMLYQNLWNKFRSIDTMNNMARQDGGSSNTTVYHVESVINHEIG